MFNFGFPNRSFPYEYIGDIDCRLSTASDPDTDPSVLLELAYSADSRVWDSLSDNPSVTPSVVFVLLYGDNTLYINPRKLSLLQMEWLFHLLDGFAYDLADDEEAFLKRFSDIDVGCVLTFCEEEGVRYGEDDEDE